MTTTANLASRSPAYPFYGRLELREATRLVGWALSLADPDTPVPLLVTVGAAQAVITPNREVETLSKLLGRPVFCGFDIELNPELTANQSPACVAVVGTDHFLENGGPPTAPSRSLVVNVDKAEGTRVVGWAVNANDETEAVELELVVDDRVVGAVVANRQRRDLLALYSSCDHGFEALLPPGAGSLLHLRDRRSGAIVFGPLPVTLERPVSAAAAMAARLESLGALLDAIRADVPAWRRLSARPLAEYPAYHAEHYAVTTSRRAAFATRAAGLERRPLFSVVMPVCDPPAWMLAEAIESVQAQAYDHWELCIADDASADDAVRALLRKAADTPRVRVVFADARGGVSINTNRALSIAAGDYVAFLDHDDRLAEDALLCMAEALQTEAPPVLYSDEDRLAPDGRHVDPTLKPDFDPELLRGLNYVCHLLVVERRLLLEVGGLRVGYEGAQDHDLVLRLFERVGAEGIRHIARVLYHWRINAASLSGAGDPAALLDGLGRAVQEHLTRAGVSGTAVGDLAKHAATGMFCARVRYALPATPPRISIIVPTKDAAALVRDCVTSVLARTDYPDYEIVLVDHDSREAESKALFAALANDPRVRLVAYHGAFNWSAINTVAAQTCQTDALCFLNNDIVVISPDWLTEMAALLTQPGCGAVGAKLLYPNDTVQHAGVILGIDGVAGHAFAGLGADEPGYLGQAAAPRAVSAVTGACLLTSRAAFQAVGGFDMARLPVAYADIDYCLKLRDKGLRVMWTPHALLYHLETQTRGADDTPEKLARLAEEASVMRGRWKERLTSDPFYNPHFEICGAPYGLLRPLIDDR